MNSVVLKRRFLHHHCDVLFLQVNYSPDANARLPEHWVLKIRTHFEGTGEINFYQQASGAARLNYLPKAGACKSWETGESVLLLESLKESHKLMVTDEQVYNQLGWRPTRALLGQLLEALAGFHACWWNQPELELLKTDSPDNDEIFNKVRSFKNKMRSDDVLIKLVERGLADIPLYRKRAEALPVTLVHGDCFPWHFFLGRGGQSVKLFDFEFTSVHSPAYDLVSLLSYWRGNYLKMFRQYHDILVDRDVYGYDFEVLLEDIKLAIAAHILRSVQEWHRGCSEAMWKTRLTGLSHMLQAVDNHKSLT